MIIYGYIGRYLLYKTKPLELILLFAPTPPRAACPKISRKFWDGRRFTLSRVPAQIFPEILGQETFGDYSLRFSPQNSSEILGRETLLHEITRDLKFLGNFGTVRPKFSGNFWNEFFLISRVKFLGNFVHTKFSEKFGTGALGVKFPGNFVHTKFPDKFGTGALGLSCEIFRKFRVQNFLEIWASNFQEISFTRNFPINLEQELWGCIPKFSGNFGVQNFLEILG